MIPSNLNRSMNFRTLILSHFGCGLGQGGCLEDSPAWLLVLSTTNLSHTYDENAVYTLPPFGLSDHNVVIVRTKKRPSRGGPGRKLISRRDTRASRKAEQGRFFSVVDWYILDSAPNIDERSRQLCDIITAGLDAIMPAVKSKVHLNDPPWITPEFKTLIAKRRQAFMSGDLASFRHLRNTVNRERKALRERFFASKVKTSKEHQALPMVGGGQAYRWGDSCTRF